MRYSNFLITNFKGIKELFLELDRKPTIEIFSLVGLNESGKTTILEALHWFYQNEEYDPHDLIPKNELANFNKDILVKAEILLSESDEDLIAKYLRKNHKYYISKPINKIIITRSYEYKNSTIYSKKWIWEMDIVGKTKRMQSERELTADNPIFNNLKEYFETRIISPIIYYQNFLFDFPDKIYVEMHDDVALKAQDQFYKDVVQDVLNAIDDNLDIDQHIIARYQTGKKNDKSSMQSVLDKLSSKIESIVFLIWKSILKISGEGLSITLGQTLEEDDEGYYLQVKVKEGDQTYFIRERSLGFRWFFSFVLFTHFRVYRSKNYENSIFLLDEPASNLHPSAQTKLLEAFDNLPDEQMIIYTTHSHHMINPNWLAGTFVVKNEAKEYKDLDISYNSYMTNIIAARYFSFVAKYPNDKDFYKPILDALDFQPSLLETVPEIIITEGKNDYYALSYVEELEFHKSKLNLSFYPSTGKDKTDYIISLYLSWGRNFIVLLDGDTGGKRTYNRLMKDYGLILENRIFCLTHINHKWEGYSLEDIFLENDRIKIQRNIFPEQEDYNKSKFNTAIQNMLLHKTRIELNKYTIDRFRKIFKFLKQKIEENNI